VPSTIYGLATGSVFLSILDLLQPLLWNQSISQKGKVRAQEALPHHIVNGVNGCGLLNMLAGIGCVWKARVSHSKLVPWIYSSWRFRSIGDYEYDYATLEGRNQNPTDLGVFGSAVAASSIPRYVAPELIATQSTYTKPTVAGLTQTFGQESLGQSSQQSYRNTTDQTPNEVLFDPRKHGITFLNQLIS